MYNNYCLPKCLFLFHQFELMSAVGGGSLHQGNGKRKQSHIGMTVMSTFPASVFWVFS